MIRIFLCSPYSGDVKANAVLARTLAVALTRRGCAALPPHLLYTQFLNDNDPKERDLGMKAGKSWLAVAQAVWVFKGNGMSAGMIEEVAEAHDLGIPVIEQRSISDFETPFRDLTKALVVES